MKRVVIVGGGASGLMAAIGAARTAQEAGQACEVVVLEQAERVGKSILATGNGRCNVSNARPAAALYRGSGYVGGVYAELAGRARNRRGPFSQVKASLHEDPVHALFASLGLVLCEEAEGRLYPATFKATTVLDVLRAALDAAGAVVRTDAAAVAVERADGGASSAASASRERSAAALERTAATPARGLHAEAVAAAGAAARRPWRVRLADGSVVGADAVVVAVGGKGVGALELPLVADAAPPVPVLGPLAVRQAGRTKSLDNNRVRCRAWLFEPAREEGSRHASGPKSGKSPDKRTLEPCEREARQAAREQLSREAGVVCTAPALRDEAQRVKACEAGEVLFRRYGVSGIAIFNLSRLARPGDELVLDLLPHVRACDCDSFLFRRRKLLAAQFGTVTYVDLLRGMLLDPVAREVARTAQVRLDDVVRKDRLADVGRTLKRWSFEVTGIGDVRQCQLTRGGVPTSAMDARLGGVRGMDGLYVTGEALDVDGPCGGYNLHWAWASGLLAGMDAASSVLSVQADGGEA
ncbi:NAD(P)/FAD-dependent oxidoreductase [Xiamenia xianingshaonis]|nr:NAD(P)/FAD-dependent oxidoreductase [Xiamenia xianingshaonis]QTU84651.1 NAD(P)/FAD-dependent oxidoreductase [Xiamenia xianingshaonis]